MEKTLPEFIRIYRDAHPDVPILKLSKIRYARELFDDALLEKRLRMQRFQRETVERLSRQGDRNIIFMTAPDCSARIFTSVRLTAFIRPIWALCGWLTV
jgi:hypothetical protein